MLIFIVYLCMSLFSHFCILVLFHFSSLSDDNDFVLVQVNKMADLVLWNPAFFGAKPEIIIKGGYIAWAQMGEWLTNTDTSATR